MRSYVWNIRIRNFHIMWLKKGIVTSGVKIGRLNFSRNYYYKKDWPLFKVYK